MKRPVLALLLAAAAFPAPAQSLTRLPAWARTAAQDSFKEAPPEGADAWVVLDRTEFAYTGSGEIRQHRQRVVRVLTDQGTAEGVYVLHGLGGKASKIKKLKGWNARPDGEQVELDQSDVVTVDSDGASRLSTRLMTGARLDRVVKGSVVAFESMEVIRHPLGPSAYAEILEEHPVRVWELALAKSGGWFTDLKNVRIQTAVRHAQPWFPEPAAGESLHLEHLPALPKDERSHPHPHNMLPWVSVAFLDPALSGMPSYESWDGVARWFHKVYLDRALPMPAPVALPSGDPAAALGRLSQWMAKELSYKQVYLTPDRGWVPEAGGEVLRRRYGDCKDLSSCLISCARGAGLEAFPVLARIVDGEVEPDEPCDAGAFNHVISAVRLPKSLGLPAEVETPSGRYLLVDPTARYTPFGRLPDAHRGRRVLVCSDRGAEWVQVPDRAVETDRVKVRVEGDIDEARRLTAAITLTEEGDGFGLRGTEHQEGRKVLAQRLMDLWSLPPTAQLEVTEASDPLDLAKPFQVKVRLVHPQGLVSQAGDWELNAFGFPGVPGLIQRAGRPRQYPVFRSAGGAWDVEMHLDVKGVALPAPRHVELDDPFRKVSADCALKAGRLDLTFQHVAKEARYGFDRREEGVKEAKKDRSQYKLLLEDLLTLKAAL